MQDKIKKVLKEYLEMKEMGIDVKRLEKNIPKNYMLQTVKDREEFALEYKMLDKLKLLRQEILNLIKNLNWQELNFREETYNEYYLVFPKKIQNLMLQYKNMYEKINFERTSKELDNFNDDISDVDNVYIGIDSLHRTHFPDGLPNSFKGLNLGFKLYRKLLDVVEYIHSTHDAQAPIHNIYYQLIREKDVNCVVTKNSVLVMKKDLEKKYKIKLVNQFLTFGDYLYYNKNVVFDGALQKQIGVDNLKEMVRQSRHYIKKGYYEGEDSDVEY